AIAALPRARLQPPSHPPQGLPVDSAARASGLRSHESIMWSDRPSLAERRRLGERLLALLPAPKPSARGARTPLRRKASPEQVALELRGRGGFAWLDGGAGGGGEGHRPAARP